MSVAIANNCNLPTTFFNTSQWVHASATTHKAGPVNYTNVRPVFVNWLISTDSEQQAYYDFTLTAWLLYNGTFYALQFGGASSISISKNYGMAIADAISGLTIPAGAEFQVWTLRVANDAGAAGSYNVITNTGGAHHRQDGIIGGTNPSITPTTSFAYGATANQASVSISSGAVQNTVTVSNGGKNYTGGPNVFAYYGPGGAGSPGALHPGSGIGAYGNPTGSGPNYALGTISVYSGGSSHSGANKPHIVVCGGNSASTGFGLPSSCYGPSCILGDPASATVSLLLHGASETAGYGSTDLYGDLVANFGVFEQALANDYGCFKMAVSGESAVGWLLNNTHQLDYIDDLIAAGLVITHVIVSLGYNDFLTNTNTNVVTVTQGSVEDIGDIWRGYGAKVINVTIPPATTSTDSFATTGNQTVYNVNFNAAGRVDSYNTAMLANTPPGDGVIDYGAFCATGSPRKWRCDLYGSNKSTGDGFHLNNGAGIPYAVTNLTLPALTVVNLLDMVGSASGTTPTAAAVSKKTVKMVGSASGTTATADASSKKTVKMDGSASGTTATADAPSKKTVKMDGAASGTTATADATSKKTVKMEGAATGTSSADAPSMNLTPMVGSSNGTTPTADAPSAKTVKMEGSATGTTATADAPSKKTVKMEGASSGTSTADAPSKNLTPMAGSSTGTSTADAESKKTVAMEGIAEGTSTATGGGESGSTGNSTGTSTADGVGAKKVAMEGGTTGISTADAESKKTVKMEGTASGTSNADAQAKNLAAMSGSSSGTSTVEGYAPENQDAIYDEERTIYLGTDPRVIISENNRTIYFNN
jgi:hypothetical protein